MKKVLAIAAVCLGMFGGALALAATGIVGPAGAQTPTTAEEINKAVAAAANGPLNGILGVNDKPLVSSDFNHDPRSSIFDLKGTTVVDGTFCRVVAWYDNEWGYTSQLVRMTSLVADKL